jgi:hypothetical protein
MLAEDSRRIAAGLPVVGAIAPCSVAAFYALAGHTDPTPLWAEFWRAE